MARLFYKDVSGTTGTVELQTAPVLIGRATDCQIQTQDAQVSRRHARVIFDGSSYWIEDTGSANGVFIGSERVPRYQLRPGTIFRCGYLEVRFELDAPAGSSGAAPHAVPVVPPAAPVIAVPVAAPVASPVAPVIAAPSAAPSAGVSEMQSLRSELESERRKRTDLEFELSEQKRKVEELQGRPAPATSDADAERLRRRVEQLESELKRKGPAGGGGGASPEALRAAEAERDRLKARVTELESKAKEPSKNDEQEMEVIRLRRRVEQLEADLRRIRGGKPAEPAPAPSGDALVSELEDKVRRLIEERDEALRKASTPVLVAPAAAAPTDPKVAEELERAKRRIDQLESELRRKPVGQVADTQRAAEQRVELEAALRQLRDVEKERDSLRELVAQSTGSARPPKAALDGLLAVSDGLADIRAALRAAGDDVALEQLEQLRATLRQACASLGLTT
ncbi:MAG: FHA domain-containing protein [Myxococcales bacterium]|nr:FHA domain-containing protein [Myxococcales bacterium]